MSRLLRRLAEQSHTREKRLFFTICSTVCEIFSVKRRNSAQRGANPIPPRHLESAMLRKPVKTNAKILS